MVLVRPCPSISMLVMFSSGPSKCGSETFTPGNVGFLDSNVATSLGSTSSTITSSAESRSTSAWFVSLDISLSPFLGSTWGLLWLVALTNEDVVLPSCRKYLIVRFYGMTHCNEGMWLQPLLCSVSKCYAIWSLGNGGHTLSLWKKSMASVEASGVV